MDKIIKFLKKVDRPTRERLEKALLALAAGDIDHLDIHPLKGQRGAFRCRVGDVRILFIRHAGKNIVYDIGMRGGIYRR